MSKNISLADLIQDLELNHEYCTKETILQAALELRRLSASSKEKVLAENKTSSRTSAKESSTLTDISTDQILRIGIASQLIHAGNRDGLFAAALVEFAHKIEERTQKSKINDYSSDLYLAQRPDAS